MLQIAPSKTDTERLLLVSPELGEVLAAIINRVRDGRTIMPLVPVYDHHDRVWNPPAPVLFQRRRGPTDHHLAAETIRRFVHHTLAVSGLTDVTGAPLTYTPHDFRRLFATDALRSGLPPHIADKILGHIDVGTTMGYARGDLSRGRHSPPPRLHRPTPGAATGRRIPHVDRRGMGPVPEPLRATQGRARRVHPRFWNPLCALPCQVRTCCRLVAKVRDQQASLPGCRATRPAASRSRAGVEHGGEHAGPGDSPVAPVRLTRGVLMVVARVELAVLDITDTANAMAAEGNSVDHDDLATITHTRPTPRRPGARPRPA